MSERLAAAVIAAFALASCTGEQWYGTRTAVGTRDGQTLYQTDCKVDASLAGGRGLFGTGPISEYYTCEGQARTTCEGSFRVVDLARGANRPRTVRTQNGPYVTVRRYTEQDVSIRYVCGA